MSENDSQHELADELLSAYLDDELSPIEHAAVESRLANDPVAQQMLHQLRSVSQSLQRLPLESVGADVRGKILDRIKKLEPSSQPKAAAEIQPAPAGDGLPKITIFNSSRSWIWASLAVAAGLLIMFLDRGEVRNRQLPAIAKNDTDAAVGRRLDEAATRSAASPMGNIAADNSAIAHKEKLSLDAASAPTAPPAPAAAPMAAAGPSSPPAELGTTVGTTDKLAMSGKVAADPAAPPIAGQPTTGLAAGGRGGFQPEFRGGAMATSRNGPADMPGANALEDREAPTALAPPANESLHMSAPPDSLVVVHVLAKPAAIQNKTFDKLLLSNGINIEVDSQEAEVRDGGKAASPDNVETAARRFRDAKAARQNEPVDMVLVDAPESALISCLASLQKDADNYVGVEVEEAPSADRAKRQELLNKKLAVGWGQYNRGTIPQQQKDNFRNEFFYRGTESKQQAQAEAVASEPTANANDQSNLRELERVQQRARSFDNRGRAVRFSPSNAENLQRSADAPRSFSGGQRIVAGAPAPATKPAQDGKELSSSEAVDNNLQVLFMLSPAEEAAASTPAEKRAE